MLQLPFAHLNLTRNPFGELTPEERGQLAVTKLERFIPRLKTSGFALQILGEQGRGKSTHLLALKRHFPDTPYIYYPEDGPKPYVPQAKLLFLDEMQRFSSKERTHIFNRPASFVIASHSDHTQELQQADLDYQSLTLKGITLERLEAILAKRLEASRRGAGAIPYFEKDALETLLAHFGDDLRAIEEYLYNIFQTLESATSVKIASNMKDAYAKQL